MEKRDRLNAAAERWAQRRSIREDAAKKINEGHAVEAETRERVQLRLRHLSEVASKSKADGPGAPAAGTIPLVSSFGMERVIDDSDFLDINFLENALAVSRSIGRVHIRSSSGRTLGYGTGFMVSPTLLMTNNHVLESRDMAVRSEIEFDYQNDRQGRPLPVAAFELDPARFFETDEALDFSLVAVRPKSVDGVPLLRYGWSRLIGTQGKALKGDALNIIQHPRGEPKQLVLRSNKLVDVFDQFLHYVTDTEPGASGAAVFNDQWEVVALHHSSVPSRDGAGNLLADDGSVWRDGMDEERLKWVANEGIRVSSLIEHIKGLQLDGPRGRLRDELLNAEPPPPLELAHRQSLPPVPAGSGITTSVQFPFDGGSISVPISLQLQFGQPVPTVALSPTLGAQAPAASRQDADAERAAAFAELEAARGRTYYDEEADSRAAASYYGDMEPGGDEAAAYVALSGLLTETHTTKLSYSPSRQVYPWVDLQPGDTPTLKSIYSGKTFDPKELIESDLEIDRRRVQLRESMLGQGGLGKESALAAESFLEASLPYNCEHVVPQSWFAKREPMRGDLHHLFACESGCNSFRGNIPFFDFTDFGEVVRSDCGKREEGKFEPGAGKGAVARATLYFLLRYPGQINNTSKEYTEDRLATLLAWHRKYPPSLYERHRNAAIQERQGNRNPLIDHPEWAGRIDFARGLG